MNSAIETILPEVAIGYKVEAGQPVIAYTSFIQDGRCAEMHAHPRAQLIYATRGSMKVVTQTQIWTVPSAQAIWVPCMVAHQVHFYGEVSICNLFIDPSVCEGLPLECFAFEVSPFLRALIARVSLFDYEQTLDDRQRRVVGVLLDELALLQPSNLFLPMARDARLAMVMQDVLGAMEKEVTLELLADKACMSTKTLHRLFISETGLSYGNWCKRAKLLEAITLLQKGELVSQIATRLGYESPSAFIFMFKKSMGVSPGQYLVVNS